MGARGIRSLVASVVLILACASPQLDRRPLFDQLGGEPGLDALVDRFLRELAADPDAAPRFRGADVKRFRTQLTLHLCQTFDGPCRYEGAPLSEVHRGMQISQRQFNAVVETNMAAVALWQQLGFRILATIPAAFDSKRHGRVGMHVMYRALP